MAGPARPQRDRKVQPPRPPNAWILYRSHQFKVIRESQERLSQAVVSKMISNMWKRETEEVKRHFEQEAETRKVQHQEQYPDYRFRPKRKDPKRGRKKSKVRDATPSDVDEDEGDDDDVPPPMPVLPYTSYMHPQPQGHPPPVPLYPHNLVMPHPFLIPYLPEARYGPGRPPPPVSMAPSLSPHGGSESPLPPRSVPSSSSSPSNQLSPTSDSQASSPSSQLPVHTAYLPSLPNSRRPSPNQHTTLPLPTLLFQDSASGEPTLPSTRLQLRSAGNMVTPAVPVWNNMAAYLPSPVSQNSEDVPNLNLAITQPQTYSEPDHVVSPVSSFDPLQGLLSRTDENGVFNLANIETSALLTHPRGDLEVTMGPQAETVDYNDDFFADFDFDEFQRQMDSFTERGSTSAIFASGSMQEDIHSLFQTSSDAELPAYAPQQRQPSAFTQDVMNFLNFEAFEGSSEDSAPIVSPAPHPTTTVAPQQVHLQSAQSAPAMPIFTHMTNTPVVPSGSLYVPPAGAIYSSTRRVGGSWKPPFAISTSPVDGSIPSWNL